MKGAALPPPSSLPAPDLLTWVPAGAPSALPEPVFSFFSSLYAHSGVIFLRCLYLSHPLSKNPNPDRPIGCPLLIFPCKETRFNVSETGAFQSLYEPNSD